MQNPAREFLRNIHIIHYELLTVLISGLPAMPSLSFIWLTRVSSNCELRNASDEEEEDPDGMTLRERWHSLLRFKLLTRLKDVRYCLRVRILKRAYRAKGRGKAKISQGSSPETSFSKANVLKGHACAHFVLTECYFLSKDVKGYLTLFFHTFTINDNGCLAV